MAVLRYPLAYIVTAVVFAAIDFIWISWATPKLYQPEIGELLSPTVRPIPAVLFYLIYVLAMTGLCVLPGIAARSWSKAATSGLLLGLAAYAAYDLTNQATLKLWSTKVTIADLCWGAFATAAASAAAVMICGAILQTRETAA